jgi:tetratricopeptide (TPR) repeat protein
MLPRSRLAETALRRETDRNGRPRRTTFHSHMSSLLRSVIFRVWFLTVCVLVPARPVCGADLPSTPAIDRSESLAERIKGEWRRVLQGIKNDDLREIHDACGRLEELRNLGGFTALDEYSLLLVEEGYRRLERAQLDGAAFFAKKALQLSPSSPSVALHSLGLVKGTGVAPVGSQLVYILRQAWSYPALVLSGVKTAIYPFLWAILFGLYISFVIYYAFHLKVILTGVARFIPTHLRGMLAPVATFALLAVPCLFGPLWCLACWSVLLLFASSEKRWLTFHTGVVLVLWGTLIPIRENLKLWLEDDGIASMLRVSEGSFSDLDKGRLEGLIRRRPSDPTVYFAYGQHLRRREDWGAADAAFARAEELLSAQPWTLAQRGLVAYLAGDLPKALEYYERAEREGLDSPEFLFNYSKARFDNLDTDVSRALHARAQEKAPVLVADLKKREEALGTRAVAEIRLPSHILLRASLDPVAPLAGKLRERARTLMKGAQPFHMAGAGVLLLLLFFTLGERKKRVRFQTYYRTYLPSRILETFLRFIPGGAWTLTGQPTVTFLVLSLFFFLAFPLVGWPSESTALIDWLPGIRPWYILGLAALWFAVCIHGYMKESEL